MLPFVVVVAFMATTFCAAPSALGDEPPLALEAVTRMAVQARRAPSPRPAPRLQLVVAEGESRHGRVRIKLRPKSGGVLVRCAVNF